jgi:hypothetical protein
MTCSWPVDRSCLPPLPDESDPTYLEKLYERNAAEDLAVQVLWSLSGRQFGACETVVRPCPNQPSALPWRAGSQWDQSVAPYIPTYEYGRWVNFPCGCLGNCKQAGPRTVHLPGPVVEIVTVTIGTEVLDPDEYVLEGTVLYRKGGNWPAQDYNKPLGENGTWSVEYIKGIPVPEGVGIFVGQLAKEFLAACSGDACRIPRNVVATTSRGVSRVFNPSIMYANGKTGLSEIDMWLAAVNPYHIMARPTVL